MYNVCGWTCCDHYIFISLNCDFNQSENDPLRNFVFKKKKKITFEKFFSVAPRHTRHYTQISPVASVCLSVHLNVTLWTLLGGCAASASFFSLFFFFISHFLSFIHSFLPWFDSASYPDTLYKSVTGPVLCSLLFIAGNGFKGDS